MNEDQQNIVALTSKDIISMVFGARPNAHEHKQTLQFKSRVEQSIYNFVLGKDMRDERYTAH